MARPTRVIIDRQAFLHNVQQVKSHAPGKKIVAMVKANAYGCGIENAVSSLEGQVDFFGVISLNEAMEIRALGSKTPCVLVQGVFNQEELRLLAENDFTCVVHTKEQIQWLLNTPLPSPVPIWIKVNTGMHRLGFYPNALPEVMQTLKNCPWVHPDIVLMTHMACADEPDNPANASQIAIFNSIDPSPYSGFSIANSASIMSNPKSHRDLVRPGIMLYGVSPFTEQCGVDIGLAPVMQFVSAISAIHHYQPPISVGYGGTWTSDKTAVIGIVPAGYGDGYPRHVSTDAFVWIRGYKAPIRGRVSMDSMAVELTDIPGIQPGEDVELWGKNLPVETVAQWAGTIGYELLCQITKRPR